MYIVQVQKLTLLDISAWTVNIHHKLTSPFDSVNFLSFSISTAAIANLHFWNKHILKLILCFLVHINHISQPVTRETIIEGDIVDIVATVT